jgi:diguanylate cyclase (GGDEF)-like protein/PAS domain S-box-containing protein
LTAVPVCLALGQLWRANHTIRLRTVAAASVAGVGVVAALWSLWREHNRNLGSKASEEAHSKFLAAVESSLDAFSILESVRDQSGTIVDFRIRYTNANAEKMLGRSRSALLGQMLTTVLSVAKQQSTLFAKCCSVVETGEPLSEEYPVAQANIKASWVRCQVVRLGDGLAVTCSNISEAKFTQERYEHLVEFTDSVFQNAPFSIVATDKHGLITAMNVAAEKLTGYSSEDLVGKAPLTVLHDENELAARAEEGSSGFAVLTKGVAAGEIEQQEWTLISRDGTRTPINLAMRSVTSDAGATSGFVSIAFDVTERRQMLDYVTHLATHDPLTGLLGRALLRDKTMEAVERARRYGTKVALFMVDLDQFKRINDSLGHASGDQVLVEAAGRLRRSVRSSDVVARVGGDEFVVMMTDITSIADVEQCAANLVARLAPEISIDEYLVNVTASIGVCIYPDFATDAKHLLKRADAAKSG